MSPEGSSMATKPLTQTTGRRKEAVARARLRNGSGTHTINGKPFEVYFPTAMQRMIVTEALRVADVETAYDIDASIHGGGSSGQAGALRMAIARSLVELDPETRPALKKAGLLTRDPRRKESKKYGLKKARKAPQYTKR
ncbi:MAG: 30S ribosomal protein S9 [Ilumatobacteraceae bacterium]